MSLAICRLFYYVVTNDAICSNLDNLNLGNNVLEDDDDLLVDHSDHDYEPDRVTRVSTSPA